MFLGELSGFYARDQGTNLRIMIRRYVCGCADGHRNPCSNDQIPRKLQSPGSKRRGTVWIFGFGISLVLGIWDLDFNASCSRLRAKTPKRTYLRPTAFAQVVLC